MPRIAIAVLFLLVSGQAAALDRWTPANTGLEVSYMTLHAVDWLQTRYIATHPDRFEESASQWAMGRNPSLGRVNAYFAFSAVIHPVVSRLLPRWARTPWQALTIVEKAHWTRSNASIGIRLQF